MRDCKVVAAVGAMSGGAASGQPEVRDVDVFAGGLPARHQHVGWFDVEVHQPAVVQRVEGVADLAFGGTAKAAR